MTAKKKLSVWTIVARVTGVLVAVGLAYAGMTAIMKFGEDRADIESRIFTSEEMRYKTELRTNQDIDPVTLSWKQDTLSKRTDTMIQQQRDLDKMLVGNKKAMHEIIINNAKRDSTYKSNEIIRQMSRDNRETKMNLLLIKVDSLLKKN